MTSRASVLSYGGEKIPYKLRYAKRKSLEIAVHPDRTVTVKVSEGTDLETIEARPLDQTANPVF